MNWTSTHQEYTLHGERIIRLGALGSLEKALVELAHLKEGHDGMV